MKFNKIFALAALVAGGLFASSLALQAQDSTNTPPPGGPAGGMRARPTFETMTKQLDLTEDQKTKAKPVIDEMLQKQRELRQDTSVSQMEKRAKSKEIRDAATTKLKDILTADQFAKWEKMGRGPRQRPPAAPAAAAAAPAKPAKE